MLRSGITVELCRVAERGSDDLLNKKRKVKRKFEPVIKKDPRYHDEAEEDAPDVIVIDGEDMPEVEDDQEIVEMPIAKSAPKSTKPPLDALERPSKRQRMSDPGPGTSKQHYVLDRGSSPDIPLIATTKGI